ncbi:hypothetical protein T06_779, partial [Trichinella sp. T6]
GWRRLASQTLRIPQQGFPPVRTACRRAVTAHPHSGASVRLDGPYQNRTRPTFPASGPHAPPTASLLASTSRRKVRSKSGWPRIEGLTSAFFRRVNAPSSFSPQCDFYPFLVSPGTAGPPSRILAWATFGQLLSSPGQCQSRAALRRVAGSVHSGALLGTSPALTSAPLTPLKRRRGAAQPERHDAELEEPQRCGERCLLPVFFGDFDLPVAGR